MLDKRRERTSLRLAAVIGHLSGLGLAAAARLSSSTAAHNLIVAAVRPIRVVPRQRKARRLLQGGGEPIFVLKNSNGG
ncbi:hypothetical protein [Paenibacillus sp. sgz302251]|uniref:hypothetical protein n=1 Tax=Paenibacillus sp. sgz302251 TaxID=3414493 RepID=UPI003C7ED14C